MEKYTLKTARDRLKISQEEAASKLGISKDTLSKYERGVSFPNVLLIKRIEKLYNVNYNQLIFLPEDYA